MVLIHLVKVLYSRLKFNKMNKNKVGRPEDNRDILKVSLLSKTKKSLNYSIRLKDGVSITEGLNEIIKQIEKK